MKVVNVKDYGGIEAASREGVHYCGRPSPLGNPCSVPGKPCPVCGLVHFGPGMVQLTDCRSIECFRTWLWGRIKARDGAVLDSLEQLHEDSVLGCWCAPAGCHCDVLIRAWHFLRDNGYFRPIKEASMNVAGTGHRPPKLGLGYTSKDNDVLRTFARQELEKCQQVMGRPITTVISGMAQGWDMALAEAALDLGLGLNAAVAFDGAEAKWPAEAKERFRSILSRADLVSYVSDPPYAAWKFAKRDRWMVEECHSLLALFDPAERKSGTGITVAYAEDRGVPVHNVWAAWLSYLKGVGRA